MPRLHYFLLLAALCSVGSMTSSAATAPEQTNLTTQRLSFWLAREALSSGKSDDFRRLRDQLQDYPLVGYLYYDDLRARLSSASDTEIEKFLARFADTSVSARLRKAWLEVLAKQDRWSKFAQVYDPVLDQQNAVLHCQFLQAQREQDPSSTVSQEWLDEVEVLWLVGRSQANECNPVFTTLREHGRITPQLIWERIRLAMANGELTFAGFLGKSLDPAGQRWVTRWQTMHNDPRATLASADYPQDLPEARDLLRHGVKRLARNDAESAAEQWARFKDKYPFSKEELATTQRDIGMAYALQGDPAAVEWLTAVDPDYTDDKAREWRVRAAVFNQDWAAVIPAIEALTQEQRKEGDWRYWQARALEQLANSEEDVIFNPAEARGDPKTQAREIYTELAKERTYYGFLANDRLGKPYDIKADPIKFTGAELTEIKAAPGLVRTYEFYQLGLFPEAKREWHYTLTMLDQRQLELATVVASRWGWHDTAIFASAKAEHRDDLEIRFPLLYRDAVFANAKGNDLDPAWVYGVIRQESAFSTEARSSAGALGLMQLMPATGKSTARRIKAPLQDLSELMDADRNIQIGSAYLRQVLDENDGHEILATASYNAGPGRVRQWLPAASMPADIWVDNVPFNETRNYIQQVMAFTTIFSQRLGLPITSLKKRMPDIGSSR